MVTQVQITLKVATPAGLFEGTFPANAKVHDVIAFVVKEMHLTGEDEYELARDGASLHPDKALSSYGIKDGTVLDLVASGSAV